MFILQMGEFASYTTNYHHSGGPRTYIIISPSHHARLETLLRLAVASDPKVPTPAMCSQFASHSKLYIPKETLIRNDIAFTEVTQYEGEMLIIFPFAYYQGFNAGPNITEEITYASERWKTFHRRDFYDPCDKKCGGEKDTFDLGFVGVEDVEMADQGGVAGGEAVEEVVQPVQRPRKGSMNRGPVRF